MAIREAAKLRRVRYTKKGLAWDHATDSGEWGLLYPGDLTITPQIYADYANRGTPPFFDVEIVLRTFQATIPVLHNCLLQSQEEFQLYAETVGGQFYNFIHDAAASIDPATGSRLVSLSHEFSITQSERYIDLIIRTIISEKQYKWLHDNLSAAATAGTAGTPWPLVANAYGRGNVTEGNVKDILVDSVSVGKFNNPVVKWTQQTLFDQFNQPTGGQCLTHDLSFNLLENTSAVKALWRGYMQVPQPVKVYTMEGEEIVYNSGVLSISAQEKAGDNKHGLLVNMQGDTVYNRDEAAPESIDLGVTDANIMEFSLTGV